MRELRGICQRKFRRSFLPQPLEKLDIHYTAKTTVLCSQLLKRLVTPSLQGGNSVSNSHNPFVMLRYPYSC